ncbi:MAG TPA: MarR family transcriptional regulator [Bryobacteraceae bacterium]|nr:MarR family transcriptional regulator [Bryobacteraceae bacterium]
MTGPGEAQVAVDYQVLAEFRFQIRKFLRFSEEAARAAGLEPQQHQFLLAIRGLPRAAEPTVSELAARLQIRHHSVVELVDRLEDRHLVLRSRSERDRRKVLIRLTPEGERLLRSLEASHREELASAGPALLRALSALLGR